MRFRTNVSRAVLLGCMVVGFGMAGATCAIGEVSGGAPPAPPPQVKPVTLKVDFGDWQKLNAQALEEYARPIRSAPLSQSEWYYIGNPGHLPGKHGGRRD